MRLLVTFAFAFLGVIAPASGQTTVTYRVTAGAAGDGRVRVEILLPSPIEGPRAFVMPRAVPMGYGQHAYDRFVEEVRATNADGAAVPVVRANGPRWILGSAASRIERVRYEIDLKRLEQEVFAGGDASRARTDYIYLLGYATFGYIEGYERGVPADLEIFAAGDWPVFTTLAPSAPALRGSARGRAADFYALADSQIVMGPGVTIASLDTAVASPLFTVVRAEFDVDHDRISAVAREAYERLAAYFGTVPFAHYTAIFEFLGPVSARHTYGFSMEHLESATFCLGPERALTKASAERDVAGFRVNVAHHMAHAWVPKRAYGQGYYPFSWEVAPALDSIWFSEGFGQYAAVDALADALPEARRAAYVEQVVDLRFRSALREMPAFLLEMPLDQLSYRGSFVYSEDFRVGRTLFSRGGLMAHEMDARIRARTGGAKRLRDALRHLVAWTERHRRGFEVRELPEIFNEATGVDTRDILERWLGPVRGDMLPGR
jgi:predicted metalloprotease with PDZ domain